MGKPSKIPKDPLVYAQMIEDLAFGVPQVRIAHALGVGESTLSEWKKRKDIRRDLAARELEILRKPIQTVYEQAPLTFLRHHPATKDAWRDTQYSETKNIHEIKEIEITLVRPPSYEGDNG